MFPPPSANHLPNNQHNNAEQRSGSGSERSSIHERSLANERIERALINELSQRSSSGNERFERPVPATRQQRPSPRSGNDAPNGRGPQYSGERGSYDRASLGGGDSSRCSSRQRLVFFLHNFFGSRNFRRRKKNRI